MKLIDGTVDYWVPVTVGTKHRLHRHPVCFSNLHINETLWEREENQISTSPYSHDKQVCQAFQGKRRIISLWGTQASSDVVILNLCSTVWNVRSDESPRST